MVGRGVGGWAEGGQRRETRDRLRCGGEKEGVGVNVEYV